MLALRSSFLAAVVALAVLAPTSTARAASAPAAAPAAKEHARALFAQGQTAYAAGDYAEALRLFEAAVQAFPAPALYFNIAQCHRRRDDPVRALEALEKYKQLDPKIPPKLLADVDAQIAEARVLVAALERKKAEQAAADAAQAEAARIDAEKRAEAERQAEAARVDAEKQAERARQAAVTAASETSTWGDPLVLGAVAGGVVVAAVTGSLVAWSLLAPGPVPPSTSLGTVDLR